MIRPSHIKVSEGLLSRARKQKIYHDVIFFYKLKSLTTSGKISIKYTHQTMKRMYSTSSSSFWYRLKRLEELGLLNRNSCDLYLKSYDSIFALLQYDLSYNPHKKRKGNFKIWLMPIEALEYFDEWICSKEIELNQSRQRYNIIRKLRCRFSDAETYSVKKIKTSNTKLDTSLSCLKVAQLIGLNHASQGCELQQRMSQLGLIRCINRRIKIGLGGIKSATFTSGQNSYMQLCNTQIVL